ncbi:MAG TPA: TfuA-like protein [Alphaproteobacteria bacterium]|nr:TfuA-like protein [Alphaproteobacteria bacterium]
MSAYVFVGPTLRPDEVAAVSDFVCLPPVAQGDVYRIAQLSPEAIGIIDGFFSGAPSVWHKEILWALSEGIEVFGSASMGALRAAELHRFGMRGIGRIFEAFRDGVLEDDDEVAVVHGPAETGFVPLSEPMVNIRATLAEAEAQGVLSAASRGALEEHAKSLFFPQRNWPAVFAGGRRLGIAEGELALLHGWLPGGRIDQKREDALAMLAAMREAPARSDPHRPSFRFEWTHYWDAMFARGRIGGAADEPEAVSDRSIVEELRLEGEEVYGRVAARTLLRLLAGAEARRMGLEPSDQDKRAVLTRLRADLGLFNRAQLQSWLERNHLRPAMLERLIGEQSRFEALTEMMRTSLDGPLLDELRLNGAYERLAERARGKRRALAGLDPDTAPAENTVALRLWFFEQRLGRALPEDIETYSHGLGFASLADFDSALRRERIYLLRQSTESDPDNLR